MSQKVGDSNIVTIDDNNDCSTYLQTENMVKLFECHYNIIDLETGYINLVMGRRENPLVIYSGDIHHQ